MVSRGLLRLTLHPEMLCSLDWMFSASPHLQNKDDFSHTPGEFIKNLRIYIFLISLAESPTIKTKLG